MMPTRSNLLVFPSYLQRVARSATMSVNLACVSFFVSIVLPMEMLAAQQVDLQPTIYKVGLAKADITPTVPIRMNGFLVRKQESTGARHAIWAKAFAVEDSSSTPRILLTVDTLGIPQSMTSALQARLGKKIGLRAENLAITASHTHTGPMIRGCAPNIFGEPIPDEAWKIIDTYTQFLLDQLEQVALDAWKNREPSTMDWGIGEVGFAKNRRDAKGPIDHDLPVLVIRDLRGKVRGIYTSYACHCVTLGDRLIGGDWAGFAQIQLERRYPGIVAMVSIGCAGDQNPQGEIARDHADLAEQQGIEIADEVDRLVRARLRPVQGDLHCQTHSISLPLDSLPTLEDWKKLAEQSTPVGYHARVQLEKLSKGESLATKIDYPIQSWHFGNSMSMVFLAGEVVSEYGLRIKQELNRMNLWVNAYSNASPCYIPSEAVLKAGGYEGGGAMIYYDQPTRFQPGLEQKIMDVVLSQNREAFPTPTQIHRTAGVLPKSPEHSLKTLKTSSNLQIELVASEPLLASPVAVDFGADGKVWLAEMVDYPSGREGDYQPGGQIRLLWSSRGDGNLDRSSIFVDDIPFPTGVTCWRDGVLICAAPDILFASDQDGDGRADVVRKLYSGFGVDNFQARVNSLEYGLDGWVYGSCGLFGGTIYCHVTNKEVALGDRDFRIRPDTGEIEPAVGRTQQGRVRDDWGNWFGCNNSALGYHYPLPDEYTRRNSSAPPAPSLASLPATAEESHLIPANPSLQLFELSGAAGLPTAACGIGVYRDSRLGTNYQDDIFTCEPVNLLVHRMKLTTKGSTFQGKRAPEDADREFVSSTDTWFRPVQVRTAPDGSLWILDMYRFIIEHPRWIPTEVVAKLDTRAGSGMGRIYRVRQANAPTATWPRLDQLSSEQLADALDSDNGWQRDMAMQLLHWKNETKVSPYLSSKIREWKNPRAVVQGLATLALLDGMNRETLLWGLGHPSPHVRRESLKHLESRATQGNDDDEWNRIVFTLVEDNDPQVRLQSLFVLGTLRTDSVGAALVRGLIHTDSDRFVEAAVLSSLNDRNLASFVEAFMKADDKAHSKYAARVLPVTFSMASPTLASQIVLATTFTSDKPISPWKWQTLSAILSRLERRSELHNAPEFSRVMAAIDASIEQAKSTATDEANKESLRILALSLLNRRGQDRALPAEFFETFLTAKTPISIQIAAIQTLARRTDHTTPKVLLAAWEQLSPSAREKVIEVLMTRSSWISTMLDQIGQGRLTATEINATRRQILLEHPDGKIRSQAETAFVGKLDSNREKLLREYGEALRLPRNAEHGRDLFGKHCALCHRRNHIGHSVGPDLDPLSNKPALFFVQEILDPNRNLDSRYVSYTALTESGQTVTGLLAAESSSAITLRGPEGKEEVLNRDEIASITSRKSSLMPEGFEKMMSQQDLADLIAFLTKPSENQGTVASKLTPEAIAKAAETILRGPEEARIEAIQSSLHDADYVILAMLRQLRPDNEYELIPWIWQVSIAAGKQSDPSIIHRVLEIAMPAVDEKLRDWQAVVIGGGIINGLSIQQHSPKEFLAAITSVTPELAQRWQHTLDESVAMTSNESVPVGTRYDALRIIALMPEKDCMPILSKYLDKKSDAELQMGSVSGLVDVSGVSSGRALIDAMADLHPNNRELAIEGLMRTNPRRTELLEGVLSGKIQAEWISAERRATLRSATDPEIAHRYDRVFPNTP